MALTPTHAPVLSSGVFSRRTNWFLVLFSLPFIGIGLQMSWLGLRGMLGEEPGSDQVMQLAAGFIFASMGSFALWAGVQELDRAFPKQALGLSIRELHFRRGKMVFGEEYTPGDERRVMSVRPS